MRSPLKQKLSESAVKAWRITSTIVVLFILLVPSALGIFSLPGVGEGGTGISIWMIIAIIVVIVVLGGLSIFMIPEMRWQQWFYEIDEHEIAMQSGIIITTRTLVPVKRVQHVDTRQGPILRMYGLANVTVSTAATTHLIPALDEQTADRVRDQISKFARLAKDDV